MELFLSQFPHLTAVVLHSLMANTSRRLLMRKLVGKPFRFPGPGTLLSLLHSGHVMISWRPLVRRIPSKQWRQKLCKHGSCFGSVNVVMHTEQDTSSWRLFSKVFISMIVSRTRNWLGTENAQTVKSCDRIWVFWPDIADQSRRDIRDVLTSCLPS